MSFQKTIIVGYVGGEVAVFQTKDAKVANFSVAVNEKSKEATKTTWFQIAAWDSLADMAVEHIVKGQLVLVEGRVSANLWVDADGTTQLSLRLTARNIRLLGGKPTVDENVS